MLAKLIELLEPAGEANVEEIWNHVMDNEDVRIDWLEDARVEQALDAARGGRWGLCAYLAARCFKDRGAAELGSRDERCHRTLWLEVADPVVVDVPQGQERLRLLLEGELEPRWVPTDQLESEIMPSNGRVLVRTEKGSVPGQLVEKVVLRTEKGPLLAELVEKDLAASRRREGKAGHFGWERSRWAEHFMPGETIELSQLLWQRRRSPLQKEQEDTELSRTCSSTARSSSTRGRGKKQLRCLQLGEEEKLRLHQLLVENCLYQHLEERLDELPAVHDAHVSGSLYHVLAYPLFGDLTKALLRPAGRSWAPWQQKAVGDAAQRLGETLVSQCAKAGQWKLVEVLLKNGVPLPDLHREFERVCGGAEVVRRQWRKDWLQALGATGTTPLLELAAGEETMDLDGVTPLSKLLAALKEAHGNRLQPTDLLGGPGGKPPPLLLRAAEVRRWNVVYILLCNTLSVAAGSFLSSASATCCPRGLVARAELKQLEEARGNPEEKSLAEYFQQRHLSSVATAPVPVGYSEEGGWFKADGVDAYVLNELLYLGDVGTCEAQVIFLQLSEEEALLAETALTTLNLRGRNASFDIEGEGWWLPIFCPRSFIQAEDGQKAFVPRDCLPIPRSVQGEALRVCIKTSCCEESLEDFVFCVGSAIVESKDEEKEVDVRKGQHRLSAPTLGVAPRLVDVGAEGETSEEPGLQVLSTPGFLYFYVQEVKDEETKQSEHYLKLTGKLEQIPEDASDFDGKVFFESFSEEGYEDCTRVHYLSSRFEPFILPAVFSKQTAKACAFQGLPKQPRRLGCQGILQKMAITTADGQRVELSVTAKDWIANPDDPCKVKLLTTAAPLQLGALPKMDRRRAPARRHAGQVSQAGRSSTGRRLAPRR